MCALLLLCTSSAHAYLAVMQHVEHILVTVSTTPVGKLYAYWAVVSTFTRLPIMFC
jgi:hypothetical protein